MPPAVRATIRVRIHRRGGAGQGEGRPPGHGIRVIAARDHCVSCHSPALSLLRQILRSAVATGLIAADPTRGIRKNTRPKFTHFLSTEEIDRPNRALDRLVEERPSYRAQSGGTGIGLSTCRTIVELHGGEIAFHTEAGKGTTFRVTLPIFEKTDD